MSSIYQNLRTDQQYKSSTGLSKAEFETLFSFFEKLYIPKKANPYTTDKLPVLTDKREALFFILHYLKSYPTLRNMGLYFGFSEYAVSTYLALLKPILKAALEKNESIKKIIFKDAATFLENIQEIDEIYIDVSI